MDRFFKFLQCKITKSLNEQFSTVSSAVFSASLSEELLIFSRGVNDVFVKITSAINFSARGQQLETQNNKQEAWRRRGTHTHETSLDQIKIWVSDTNLKISKTQNMYWKKALLKKYVACFFCEWRYYIFKGMFCFWYFIK